MMSNSYIGLDFEYNNSNEKKMNVICAAMHIPDLDRIFKYNLSKQLHREVLLKDLTYRNRVILSYAVTAESRALKSLGIDPMQFKWLDLYAEFRMLCNSNNKYNYGSYIAKDGSIAFSTPPKPDEESEEDGTSTPKNLVNALYKMCGIRVDSKQKDEMRELILSKDDALIQKHIEEIMEYCASDTVHLSVLFEAICTAYSTLGLKGFENDMLERGRYAAAIGVVEANGIPINLPFLNKIIEKTPAILESKEKEVDKIFPNYFIPETVKEPKVFKNGKIHEYKPIPKHKNTKALQELIAKKSILNFPKTDTGLYKTDKQTLQDYSHIEEFKALLSYNNLDNNLKWFKKDNSSGFFNNFGSDNRVRPYFGIFGTQTGRNAARATTFPFAMGTWLRSIIQPPKGQVIIGSDFSQQEVYVAAKLSSDSNLMNAYLSGDVYLYFGKLTGVIPKDGTKKTHADERNQFKATVLGKQFGMGVDKLHKSLINSSKSKDIPREKAEIMDRYHKETFQKFWEYTYACSNRYKNRIPLITPDGWTLWQDNPMVTSVRNFMIQGTAAAITRKAVILLVEQNIKVIAPLHDAIYALVSQNDAESVTKQIEEAMKEATRIVLNEEVTSIRIDTKVIHHGEYWIDDKGKQDWERLKPILGVK